MRHTTVSLLLIFCLVVFAAPSFGADSCRLFLVKEIDGDVGMDVVTISEGEVRVFQVGAGSEVLEIVWTISPGKSGNLVQRSTNTYTLIVTYSGGQLSLRSRGTDGKERLLPSIKPEDMCNYNVRVNAIGGNGIKKAFRISRCGDPEVDNGPVFDIFGGKIPMAPGDYTVTIETTLAKRLDPITGVTPLFLRDETLFCTASIGGREGNFIVDTAAGVTALKQGFLPANTEITRLTAIAYSSDGVEERDGVMQGAGGAVSNFLGVATIPELQLGTVLFENVDVSVLSDMHQYGDTEVDGIIGLDLLRRAEAVTIFYPEEPDEEARLVLHARTETPRYEGHEIPFVLADQHIFVDGSLNGRPARFLVDSGARGSFVPPALMAAAGLEKLSGKSKTFKGLDENKFQATTTRIDALQLGDVSLGGAVFYAGDLAVFKQWGINEDTVLLGNDQLIRFGKLTLDFEGKTMRFGRRGE
jgi:predicted aspartyl protease